MSPIDIVARKGLAVASAAVLFAHFTLPGLSLVFPLFFWRQMLHKYSKCSSWSIPFKHLALSRAIL